MKMFNKKCLVLDLDNTLWGGVVGEEGVEGIALGFEPPGSYFLAFQQAILDLYHKGIILTINSKNNFSDAIEVIRSHPNMVLKEEHFAAMRINWNDKTQNMRELAQELNIGLDSFVFLDDDPLNRALVRAELPEVVAPDLPKNPKAYAPFLIDMPYFVSGELTDEDKMRGSLYVTELLRKKAEDTYTSREDFLKGLGLKVTCAVDDASCLARLSQLSGKTNQFNSNKMSMNEDEIRQYITAPDCAVFYCAARDSFGDYGVVGFALVQKDNIAWRLTSLLVSCRALGRGIEEAFFDAIVEKAREAGVQYIEANFAETEKNQPAKSFIEAYFENFRHSIGIHNITPSWIERVWKN